MNIKLTFIGIVIAMITLSCKNDDSIEKEIIKINHFKTVAYGPFAGLFMNTQGGEDLGTDKWSIFYNSIENFEYEFGYVYTLSVVKTKIEAPPQDGSDLKYKLEELISKEKIAANTEFEITLRKAYTEDLELYVTGNRTDGFQILNQIHIDCGDLCEELEAIQNKDGLTTVTGVFKHTDMENTVELKALNVED